MKESIIETVIEFIKDHPFKTSVNFGLFLMYLAFIINCFSVAGVIGGLGLYIVLATVIFVVDE